MLLKSVLLFPPVPTFRLVLVEPIYPANVGYVARVCSNFAVKELVLVGGCPIDGLARERATHGNPVLEAARRVETLEDALADCGLSVATSARSTQSGQKHRRDAMTPAGLRRIAAETESTIALVFGREDDGLTNDEVARCDLVVTIPMPGNPSLNIAHAAAVLLYALNEGEYGGTPRRLVDEETRRHLYRAFDRLLEATHYPPHKRPIANVMWRRFVGRAAPSTWEYHRLMGVFTRTLRRLGTPLDEEE